MGYGNDARIGEGDGSAQPAAVTKARFTVAKGESAYGLRFTALIRTVSRDPYAVTPLVSVCR